MATPIPENTATFVLEEIQALTHGSLTGRGDVEVRGVSTDSRGNLSGKLFVALKGERFDGHRFVGDAIANGAAAVLVARGAEVAAVPTLFVDDPLDALGRLAAAHRLRWGGRVVAVAGSAGKTTTRGTISAALEAVLPKAVHSTVGNLNNRIGVPMMLLGLQEWHRVAVIEIGTNQSGEVAALTATATPDIGVLTLVEIEHSEGLGSLDDIEDEEGALFKGMTASGTAIANADDPRAMRQLVAASTVEKWSFGESVSASYRVVGRRAGALGRSIVRVERPVHGERGVVEIECSWIGRPGALAVAAAIAVADSVAGEAVDASALRGALSAASASPGRLRPIELEDRSVVVDDTYNSNPASVLASVQAALEISAARAARLILAIGEMRELGPQSATEHDRIGDALAQCGAALLVAVAGDAKRFVAPARARGMNAVFCDAAKDALQVVLDNMRAGDVVLVKASRGVRAEQIVEGLVQAKGLAA